MCPNSRLDYFFTWKIENYSSCYQVKGKSIISPSFIVENLCSRSEFYLSLYPKGKGERLNEDKESIPLFLCRQPLTDVGTVEKLDIFACIQLLDDKNNVLNFCYINSSYTEETNAWGSGGVISIDELSKEMGNWKDDVLTVRCGIECGGGRKLKITELEAITTINVDRRLFEWNVKIPMLLKYTESINFSMSNHYNFEITLHQNLDIFFHLKKRSDHTARPIRFKIAICDKDGNAITSNYADHLFQNAKTWKFPDTITKDVLEVCKIDSINCEFKIIGEIIISLGTLSSNKMEKLKCKTSVCTDFLTEFCSASSLQSDIGYLYNNELFSDVSIKVKTETYSAHKLILRTRAPVFADQVEQLMLKNETHIVDLSDEFEEITMECLLEFIYTGTVSNMLQDWTEALMLAAKRYEIPSLMDECLSFLKREKIEFYNVCDIFSTAKSFECEDLKSRALSFIRLNAAKILAGPDWTDWANLNNDAAAVILSELSDYLLQKCK